MLKIQFLSISLIWGLLRLAYFASISIFFKDNYDKDSIFEYKFDLGFALIAYFTSISILFSDDYVKDSIFECKFDLEFALIGLFC